MASVAGDVTRESGEELHSTAMQIIDVNLKEAATTALSSFSLVACARTPVVCLSFNSSRRPIDRGATGSSSLRAAIAPLIPEQKAGIPRARYDILNASAAHCGQDAK